MAPGSEATDFTETKEMAVDEIAPGSPPTSADRVTPQHIPSLQLHVNIPPITGSTPLRSYRKTIDAIAKGMRDPKNLQSLVVKRAQECVGSFPIKSESTRGTCVVCAAETKWFCVGCHVNVCVNNISDTRKHAAKYAKFECNSMDLTIAPLHGSIAQPKVIKNCEFTCFLLLHQNAIFDAVGV